MEEIKRYRCSTCGKEFISEGDCIEHELHHKKIPAKVVYGTCDSDEMLPNEIEVEFPDGYRWKYINASNVADKRNRRYFISSFRRRLNLKRHERK